MRAKTTIVMGIALLIVLTAAALIGLSYKRPQSTGSDFSKVRVDSNASDADGIPVQVANGTGVTQLDTTSQVSQGQQSNNVSMQEPAQSGTQTAMLQPVASSAVSKAVLAQETTKGDQDSLHVVKPIVNETKNILQAPVSIVQP